MYFRCNLLCETLAQYKKIIIYGTGNFAQKIFPQLVEHGLKEKILCFTQTKKYESDFLYEIPVIDIKELQCDKLECVVLVAVSDLHAKEIKRVLLDFAYLNIVTLADYMVDHMKMYRLDTFEEYCGAIADWYAQKQGDKFDRPAFLKKLMEWGNAADQGINPNLIVVICGHISPRFVKIIGALKRKGYEIVMLKYMAIYNPWSFEELEKENIPTYHCDCIEEMLYRALQYSPLVYFFESMLGDSRWAEIMFKNKKYFGKVIISLYDVINDGYSGQRKSLYMSEKYALEHADGIVWRWFSKESLERKGFQYQGKSIQFIDCCHRELEDEISSRQDSDPSVLKFCAIGADADFFVKRHCVSEYTDFARIGEILEKIGNRKDCIFHFYAGSFEHMENYETCKKYEQQYDNFKIFLATEHRELLKRLKNYDFGCDLYIKGKELTPDALVGNWRYGGDYLNSIRNTFFDFLSAGLPIITTQGDRLWEYLSAYDVVVKMYLDDLDFDYLRQHKTYYREKVKIARKDLEVDRQIPKLIQFFKEV